MSKEFVGNLISRRDDRTITIAVRYREKHPKYPKYLNFTRKYHVHVEDGTSVQFEPGDIVVARHSKKISKTKSSVFVRKVDQVS